MIPPLVIDRGPLIAARVAAIKQKICKAKTTLTVRQAVHRAERDAEIRPDVVCELKCYARKRIGSIRGSRQRHGGDK